MTSGNIIEHLIPMFDDQHIELTTTIVLCEAIAAEARLNIWFIESAKGNANATDNLAMAFLDRIECHTDRCAEIVREFHESHDLKRFEAAIQELTQQLASELESGQVANL